MCAKLVFVTALRERRGSTCCPACVKECDAEDARRQTEEAFRREFEAYTSESNRRRDGVRKQYTLVEVKDGRATVHRDGVGSMSFPLPMRKRTVAAQLAAVSAQVRGRKRPRGDP